ncbi:MAG: bifunctional 5,10-methylenetetrahydrofolate dehydrogenase/5,10-methenyltetrahydrofolate cyclohydrolase [Candidatus Omnitrophica bacterium]|nr:bifunctional 5,10-methylenetetrahydrofolate dehydrogenase/5,10-methenyltetrahydrofolate cyclohydrolase [Candidatus Omnitrophota bacterium]
MSVILHADKLCEGLKKQIKIDLESVGKLCLASVLTAQKTSEYYQAQRKLAEELGVDFPIISPAVSLADLKSKLEKLNNDPKVIGIILNKPLFPDWNDQEVFSLLDPDKDVEGMHPLNLGRFFSGENKFISPTAASVIELLKETKVELKGKRVVIVGFSSLIGKPLTLFLANEIATVTIVHKATKKEDLPFYIANADILISAAGVPELIKADWIKEGAVVIDVGTGQRNGKTVGDVEFDKAKEKTLAITPVPGGVGRLTTMFLFANLVSAAKSQKK